MRKYSPRMSGNKNITNPSVYEGVIEVKCGVVDCTLNDRTAIDRGFGFCQTGDLEIDDKGNCKSYCPDFMFIIYRSKRNREYEETD